MYRINHFAIGWREFLPETFDTAILVQDGHFELRLEQVGFRRRGEKLFSLIYEHPEWFQQLQWRDKEPADRLFSLSRELKKINYLNLSDHQISTVAKSFLQAYQDAHIHGVLMSILEFEHELLTKYLLSYLDHVKHRSDLKTSQLFTILTSSCRDTYARRQIQSEYRLLRHICNSPTLQSVFESVEALDLVPSLPIIDPAFSQIFDVHHESFCWLSYGTDGPSWTKAHLIKSLHNLLKTNVDPDISLKELKTRNKNRQRETRELTKKLMIDDRHQNLFQIARDSVYLKALRKDATSYAFYCAEGLFRQMAKRMKLGISQLRMLLPDELAPAFLKRSFDPDELNSRSSVSAYAILDAKSHFFVGDKARVFRDSLHSQEIVSRNVLQLRGTCAVAGKARGIVAIINTPTEMTKMREGNILVSCVTDVNLEPAMLMASAIVTDSGGMTSHAAILAREMGITCVVGTKVATEILADGDEVEVDAETGVVRILKRACNTT